MASIYHRDKNSINLHLIKAHFHTQSIRVKSGYRIYSL